MADQLSAVHEWYVGLDRDIQIDISGLLLPCLTGQFNNGEFDDAILSMTTWLTPQSMEKYQQFGRAVSFGAVFEAIFSNRFNDDGWVIPQAIHEQIARGESPAATERLKQFSERFLTELPAKQATWKAVGESWKALSEKYLGSKGADRLFAPSTVPEHL